MEAVNQRSTSVNQLHYLLKSFLSTPLSFEIIFLSSVTELYWTAMDHILHVLSFPNEIVDSLFTVKCDTFAQEYVPKTLVASQVICLISRLAI